MEQPEQDEMKISSTAVRRLRIEHGWSQEQLAAVSGISLRTVQRVEAEGSASLETRASFAAAFGVQIADLAEAPLPHGQTPENMPHLAFARYQAAAVAAGIACIPLALALAGVLPASIAWLDTASTMAAIALALYAGLGWYMTGAKVRPSRLRRLAQALFVFGSIFSALALAYRGSDAALALPALMGLLAIVIYFVVDAFVSRHRTLRNPAR